MNNEWAKFIESQILVYSANQLGRKAKDHEFAAYLGVDPAYISHWKKGYRVPNGPALPSLPSWASKPTPPPEPRPGCRRTRSCGPSPKRYRFCQKSCRLTSRSRLRTPRSARWRRENRPHRRDFEPPPDKINGED
jgi:hypothetical protein